MAEPNPQARFPSAPGTRPRGSKRQGTPQRRVVTQRRTPIDGEMGGTQTETTYENYPPRPSGRQRVSQGVSTARDYGPTRAGEKVGTIGTLEAEYIGCILLICLTVFTDASSSYSDKMLAVMKRGTLASVLFFILALFSTAGEGSAKFAKAFGLLTMAGIFLSTGGQGTISVLDTFFKADWTSSGASNTGDSSAGASAGTQQSPPLATEIGQAATVPGNVISETIDGLKVAITVPKDIGNKAISTIKGILGGL